MFLHINKPLLRSIIDVVLVQKWRWSLSFCLIYILTIIEMSIIYVLYLLLDLNKINNVLSYFSNITYTKIDLTHITDNNKFFIVFVGGLLLLCIFLLLKYLNEINLLSLRVKFFYLDALLVIENLFQSDYANSTKIKKETIIDSILIDSGIIANIIISLVGIFGAIISSFAYILAASYISIELIICVLFISILPVTINYTTFKKMQIIGLLKNKNTELVYEYFIDIFSGLKRIKIDSLELYFSKKSNKYLKLSQQWRISKVKTQTQHDLVLDGVSLFGIITILFLGNTLFQIELASLLVLLVMFNRIKGYVATASRIYLRLQRILASVSRQENISNKLQYPSNVKRNSTNTPISKVELRNVSFRYSEQEILQNINLRLNPGDRVLIQGKSGCGKSTLLEIILGILSPTSGQILYNNNSMTNDYFYKIRDKIAYISPTLTLFNGNFSDNLDVHGCKELIVDALDKSELGSYINSLPQKMNENIGRNGDNLSLGQRQRLILSRLFLKDPSIIILDEATANLDIKLENKIAENILSFIRKDSILIVVAHKLPKIIHFNKQFNLTKSCLTAM